jgi:hypothetical protein
MADRPVEAALTAAVVLGLAAVLVLRRRRGRGAAVLAEGACRPAWPWGCGQPLRRAPAIG